MTQWRKSTDKIFTQIFFFIFFFFCYCFHFSLIIINVQLIWASVYRFKHLFVGIWWGGIEEDNTRLFHLDKERKRDKESTINNCEEIRFRSYWNLNFFCEYSRSQRWRQRKQPKRPGWHCTWFVLFDDFPSNHLLDVAIDWKKLVVRFPFCLHSDRVRTAVVLQQLKT